MSENLFFDGRLAIQQRVLPVYRAPFFDTLASLCTQGLSVFAGQPQPDEQIQSADHLDAARLYPAVNRHQFKVGSPFYQCRQVGILEWLEGWRPDVLIVEANPRYPTTLQAIDWMHHLGKSVLGWGLGVPSVRGILSGLRSRSRRNFLRSLDGVIAYSQRGAAEYMAAGFPQERVFIALNAAAHQPDDPMPERPLPLQKRPIVLFVGRLQARKRIDLLMEACAALPEELKPNILVVGDGPVRYELEVLAARIYPQAQFPGALYGQDLDRIFKQADLFVLPGTGGLAVQQAMSFALPVIVAQGDGTQDDLVCPGNGWQIPADDLTALSRTLREALSDIERLRRMGAESYRIVTEEVNLEQMAASFINAINSVVALPREQP